MMIYSHSFLPVAVHAALQTCIDSHCQRGTAAYQGWQLAAAQTALDRLLDLSQEKKKGLMC